MRPRWFGVGAVIVGVAVAGALRLPVRADETPGSGFQSLSLTALASSQRVIADQVAGQPPGTADTGVPDAEATMTASTGHALASAAWPSALVGNAGSLLYLLGPNPCTPGLPVAPAQCSPVAVPAPVLNQYHYLNDPIRAEAQYPTRPHDVNTIPGASMQASTDPTKVSADALVGGATASDAYRFGSMHASSTLALTGATQATADAVTSAGNLSFAGGVISVGSVASEAHATTDGQAATSKGSTTVHDMTVQGIPVYVDSSGIHAGSATVPDAAGTGVVNQILANFGYTLYLTKPTTTTKGGTTSYSAPSLVVVWDTAPSKPGTMDIVFVFGGASVSASANLPFSVPSATAPGGVTPNSSDVGTSDSSVSSSSSPSSSDGSGASSSSPTSSGGSAPVALPELPAAHTSVPHTGIAAWWVILALLGTVVMAGGFRRLPDRVLDEPANSTACDLGEET